MKSLFLALFLASTVALSAQTVEDSQKAAIAKYPELGKPGSDFHTQCLFLYNATKASDPKSLEDPNWPMVLADRAAGSKKVEFEAQKAKLDELVVKNLKTIREIETDQISFLDKPFMLNGRIDVSDYYNYGYKDSQETHFSFVIASEGRTCHAYMERSRARDLRKQLLESKGGLKAVLVVAISEKRYQKSIGLLVDLIAIYPPSVLDSGSKK